MAPNLPAEPVGPGLGELVARSLTGTDQLSGAEALLSEPAEIATVLRRCGWTSERLMALRDERQHAGLGWPAVIPLDERGQWGMAQLHAACQQVAAELGVVPQTRQRDHGQPLSPRDRSLIAERPPHHGTVG